MRVLRTSPRPVPALQIKGRFGSRHDLPRILALQREKVKLTTEEYIRWIIPTGQRGFIQLTLMGYVAIAGLLVIAGLTLALRIQTARLDAANETIAQVKAVGEAQEAQRLKDKERADADHKARVARLERDNNRLRLSASTSVLPSTASAPGACISGAVTERAVSEFVRETAELIVECGQAVEALDSAKRWSQGQ